MNLITRSASFIPSLIFLCVLCAFFLYHAIQMDKDRAARIIQKHARNYLCSLLQGTLVNYVQCPVCIENGGIGIKLRCKHEFHIGCILKWIHCDQSCPICRRYTDNTLITRMKYIHAKLIEIFKIPIETLLKFENAVDLKFFTYDKEVYENMEKHIRLLNNNSDCMIDDKVTIVCKKYALLIDLTQDIHLYNQRAKGINISSTDLVLETIRRRLSLPLSFLVHTPHNSHQPESDHLGSDTLSRQLRARLCAISQIKKKMESFNQLNFHGYASSSMSIVPFPFRPLQRSQAVLAMTTSQLPISLEQPSDSD